MMRNSLETSLVFPEDPEKDYRKVWQGPEHFLWDQHGLPMIDYLGYLTLVREILPPPPLEILDVGCGDGFVAAILANDGYRVTGIDFSARAVAFAKIFVPEGKFYDHDIRSLKDATWLHGKFPAALLMEVLEHIPPEHHSLSLEGIRRCLAEGGKLFLSVPSANMPMISLDYKHFAAEELKVLLDESGFLTEKVIFQHEIHYLYSPRLWRWLCNRYYDLRALRRALHRLFMARFNRVKDSKRAGRLIVQAVRKS